MVVQLNEMTPWNDRPWPFPEGRWPADFLQWWRNFFGTESEREPECTTYDQLFSSPLCSLQRRRELQQMLDLAAALRPERVMEIGTDKGSGFYHWCKCFPSVRQAIAVEIRGLPYAELFEQHFPGIQFLWIEESSHTVSVGRLSAFLDGDLDCLFIDGDKSGMRADVERFGPLVRSGGVVFVHDITDPEPGRAFAAIAQGRRHLRIFDRTECDEAIQRQESGQPAHSSYEGWLRYWRGRSCGVGVVYM